MTRTLQAVYEDGVLKPTMRLDLPEGARVDLLVVSPVGRQSLVPHVRPEDILADIAALPLEDGAEFTARDHDRILYGTSE